MSRFFTGKYLSPSCCSAVFIALLATGIYTGYLYRDTQSIYLQVLMRSSVKDTAELYYDIGQGLSEMEKARVAVAGDHQFHSYRFPLPRHIIHHLRFDPIAISGKVAIKSMMVVNGLDQPLLTIDLNRLMPIHQIKSFGLYDGSLILLTEDRADDPQVDVLLNAPLDLESLRHFSLAFFLGRLFLVFLIVSLCFVLLITILKKRGVRIAFLDHPLKTIGDLSRGNRLLILAILVILLFRGWFAWTYPLESCSDSSTYYELFRSGESILVHATGYPFLMHFLSPLLPTKRDLLLLQHFLDFGVQLVVMIFLKRRFGNVAAVTAGLFYGLDPRIINWASRSRPEWLQGAFLVLAFTTAIEAYLSEKTSTKASFYLFSAWAFTWTVLVKFLTAVLLPVYLIFFFFEKKWQGRWFCFPAMGVIFFLQLGIFIYWYHYPSTGAKSLTYDKAWVFSDKISSFLPVDQPFWNAGPWSRRYALIISEMPMNGFDVNIFTLYRRVDAVSQDVRGPYQKRYKELLTRSDPELMEEIKGKQHLKSLRNNYLVSGYFLGLPATDSLLTRMFPEAIARYPRNYFMNVFEGIRNSFSLGAEYYFPTLKNPRSDHPFQLDARDIRYRSPEGYVYYDLPDPMRCLYDDPVFLISGLKFFSRWVDLFHAPTLGKWFLLFVGILCVFFQGKTGFQKRPETLYLMMGMLVLVLFIFLANMIFQFRDKELQACQHLLCALMGISLASIVSFVQVKWRRRIR